MSKKENIQAFPVIEQENAYIWSWGMDLRDYFAAQAMRVVPYLAVEVYQNPDSWGAEEIAEESYKIADAMMEARKCQS